MFILVESGSTKTDWVAVNAKTDPTYFKTSGVNPSTQTNLFDITQQGDLTNCIQKASDIYFYGAGVISTESKNRISQWLKSTGTNAKIYVFEDMLAAARACFGHEQGIICILGTGSNSGVYDGHKITASIPTLGYVFSDEGAGTNIGKEIIKSYFYNEMPSDIKREFEQQFQVTKDQVIENVYRSSTANKYIASFASFLHQHNSQWKDDLLFQVFKDFIDIRIAKYPDYINYSVSFVGSIAYLHQNILKEVASHYNINIHSIIQSPINQLIEFHKTYNNE